MSMRLLVNSMPMLKRNPLRLRKLHFKSFHFNIVFKEGLFVLAMEKSLLSCLRALELPGQNSIFPCKGTVDRKNVKCRCRFQSEGLPAAFRKFPVTSKFGHSVRTLRPHTCLIFPFVRSGNLARKTVLPAKKLKRLQQKGKNQINK